MTRPEKEALSASHVRDRKFVNAYGDNRAARRAAKSMKRKGKLEEPEKD